MKHFTKNAALYQLHGFNKLSFDHLLQLEIDDAIAFIEKRTAFSYCPSYDRITS